MIVALPGLFLYLFLFFKYMFKYYIVAKITTYLDGNPFDSIWYLYNIVFQIRSVQRKSFENKDKK